MAGQFQPDLDEIAAIPSIATILDTVCAVTGMGFAAVAHVTTDSWVACAVKDDIAFGLAPGGEMKIETTFCNAVRATRAPLAIGHVAENPTFRTHMAPAMYGFQSYIAAPIILPTGEPFGTLCALDRVPAEVEKPEILNMFMLFADLIGHEIDSGRKLRRVEAALNDERRTAALRETDSVRRLHSAHLTLHHERQSARQRQIDIDRQLHNVQTTLLDEQKTAELREMFIAILGHDLRNPLAAISAGLRLVARTPLNERAARIVPMMEQSVDRMAELISNVLDFTRGRLIGGIELSRSAAEPLAPVLRHIISELTTSRRGGTVVERISLAEPVDCDRGRIGQMLSNLLSNAVDHGTPDQPIEVTAIAGDGRFMLSVCNRGPEIPADQREFIFEAFNNSRDPNRRRGLGLGLYIAAEIARAHGGQLTVHSSAERTCFLFEMPNAAVASEAAVAMRRS